MVALIFGSIVITASALTIKAMMIEKINVWGSTIQDTQFSIVVIDTKIKGPNKIEITLTLKNDDSSTHTATVTVQLLDNNDEIILEETKGTGEVGGGGNWSAVYSFTKVGLVAEYTTPFIVIKQLS